MRVFVTYDTLISYVTKFVKVNAGGGVIHLIGVPYNERSVRSILLPYPL